MHDPAHEAGPVSNSSATAPERRPLKPHPQAPRLTPRELEILQWTAAGKTSWEIATILGCSQANVEFHVKNLRRKFQVSSRRLVVIHALAVGLIAYPSQPASTR